MGDWYARGLPGPDPPADGVATCRGDTSDKDCWGKCAEIDLITEIGRSMMIAVVDRVINEVEGLFALIPSQEPLTFDKSPGRYAGAYLDNGYASEDKCARDCTMLSGVAVNDDYCDTGFDTDAGLLELFRHPNQHAFNNLLFALTVCDLAWSCFKHL